MWRSTSRRCDVVIYKNYSPDIPPFFLDGELMERVIYNLLLNAAQASPPQGSITVKTRQVDDTVEIAVIDRGSGIDREANREYIQPVLHHEIERGWIGTGDRFENRG